MGIKISLASAVFLFIGMPGINAGNSLAQERGTVQDGPIMGSPMTEQVTTDAGDPQGQVYRILVIGDSLAGGIGAGLTRASEAQSDIQVINRFQEASGLARPEVYDWAETFSTLAAGEHFDAVVVLIGLNDRQEIRNGEYRFIFDSPEWTKAYQAQVARLVAALSASKAKVYWLAIPPMQDAQYNADMQIISALQAREVEAAGFVHLDPRSILAGPNGQYTPDGPDVTGAQRRLREDDGISFTEAGTSKLGTWLLEEVNRQRDTKTNLPLGGISASSPVEQQAGSSPLFGQMSQDGQVSTFAPKPGDALQGEVQSAPSEGRGPISRSELLSGSSAESLYTQGLSAMPPRGRFDDYTLATQ